MKPCSMVGLDIGWMVALVIAMGMLWGGALCPRSWADAVLAAPSAMVDEMTLNVRDMWRFSLVWFLLFIG